MRVLLINQTYHPDVAATAQHAHDLARHLVAHGHEVEVIASRSLYGHAGAALAAHEVVDGIEIHRVGVSLFGKRGIAARAADFALFYVAASIKSLQVRRADVVVCLTTPPFISLVGMMLRAFRGSRYVHWLMDMYPDVAVACGVLRPGSFATRAFDALNRWTLRAADRVVVLGRCMRERVLAKLDGGGSSRRRSRSVDPARIVHIGVWSDQAEVRPVPREENPYRREWGLRESFVAMYSGNFGVGHDVETMLAAAERLRHDPRIRFAFVGGGKRKPAVDAFVAERRLATAVVAGYQPRERLDASLSCADVHLVSLREGLEGCIVPCKLFGAMAAERPTIFIGHPSSEIARVLEEQEAGLVVREGDVDGLVAALRGLATEPERARQLGANARRALASEYARERSCEAWRRLLERVVAEAA
ncbi:MAG TPA: glycosyltransferase family 4 protein [Phycisphaerales bacterium]|nr:glycosyltransferase family 4 protein [Phycisphaerales bacterium]HMP38250.1 glycosyltransferase family 4 protein [Phycisphaerales bacterium]